MILYNARSMLRLTVVALVFCLAAAGADWPQWRGPERTGVSTESDLLEAWPEGGPRLLWKVESLGDGYATPSVVGDRIYALGNRGMDNEFVQALSVADGSQVWSVKLGGVGNPDQQPSYPMARSTPTIDGDTLYALSSDGDLVAVRIATGEELWRKSLRGDFSGLPGKWAYAESPLIDGDTLVVAPGGAEATVVALDKKTGEARWRSAVPGGDAAAYSSAIVLEAAGRKQYVEFLDKGVIGLDAATGEFLWRYDGTAGGPANVPTPVHHDGYVYSANARRFGGGLVQLHAADGGVTAEEVYFARGVPNSMGGQVLLDGDLYGTNPDGPVSVDFLTGEVNWQADGGPGAALLADGRFYFHLESGEVRLVEATPEEYREKGRFTPPGPPARRNGDREMAWVYPVVANGRLYLRDLGTLWCYDIAAR